MVEPFTVESLYPENEEEDADGNYATSRKVLPHQLLIHNPPKFTVRGKEKKAYCILHSGAYGSGKSLNMSVQIVYLARKYPGIKIVVATAYDYFFEEFILATFEKVLPVDSPLINSYNMKNRTIVMVNGSTIRFKAYDEAQKIKGWECHILWIEEGSELGGGDPQKALAIFQALQGRHRAKGNYPRQIYISQNPKGHNWLWKLFIRDSPMRENPRITWTVRPFGHPDKPEGDDPLKPKGVSHKEYEYITPEGEIYYCVTSGTSANDTLPAGYVERMNSSYDAESARRFIEGDFNPINTLIYDWPIFSTDTHVVELNAFLEYWDLLDSEEPEIPAWWPIKVGIDVGGSVSPWAVQFYVETPEDEYGVTHLVCFDELYMRKVAAWKDAADAINAKCARFENVTFFIDPKSGPKKEGANQQSIITEFASYDINCSLPRFYNKNAGILSVKSLMQRDMTRPCPYKEDVDDGATYPDAIKRYNRGAARLYYLRSDDWVVSQGEFDDMSAAGDNTAFPNEYGYACPANIKEKEVWRNDTRKQREGKETEEGLAQKVQEKPVDSDDHAQTAEIFAIIGWQPLASTRSNKKRQEPVSRYTSTMRRNGGA